MDVVFLAFFSFLPCLLWLWFCLRRKYATSLLIPFLTAAAAAAIICSVLARLTLEPFALSMGSFGSALFSAVVVTAIPEELTKLLFLIPFIRTGPERRLLPSKTVYARAVFIALAFASFENILFALRYPGVLPLRFFSAVPLHAAAALFSAVWLYERLSGSRHSAHRFTLFSAFFFHSVYAYGLSGPRSMVIVAVLAVAFAGSRAVFLWQTAGRLSHE